MSAAGLITVFYSCARCGLRERSVIVPERDQEMDVVKFVHQVAECVGADHSRVSPQCRATHITELKIPVDNSDAAAPIGTRVAHGKDEE